MEKISFTINSEFIELFKLLKVTGLCDTGGVAKCVVSQSEVKVDGQVETRK
ncbi:MAG: RNA-binding S4 domain-containing protein, partial [Candidatus Omnitrophota bacterium]